MSNIIVQYHNDFNKIQLPSFTEQEMNLLFNILSRIKETNGKKIRLFRKDIIVGKMESREHFTAVMDSLKNKFFKASFRHIIETETEFIDTHFHFFNTIYIHYRKKNPDDGYDTSKIFECIDLEVNPHFSYLVNELTANFTRFELSEFISLSGKYTKTLYRLLKQFRNTGLLKMQWQEFIKILDIPENYKHADIDKRILKPAIKELTSSRILFNEQRIPFKNLAYEKIKEKGTRGRGGKVIGIEFSFEPELQHELQKAQQMETIIQEKEQYMEKIHFANFEGQHFATENFEAMKIIKIWQDTTTKHFKMKIKNMENNKIFDNDYPTENHLKKYLIECGLDINQNKIQSKQPNIINNLINNTFKRF